MISRVRKSQNTSEVFLKKVRDSKGYILEKSGKSQGFFLCNDCRNPDLSLEPFIGFV